MFDLEQCRIAGRGIKISVDDAAAVAELQLEARPFADLQGWIAKLADDLLDGQTDQAAAMRDYRSDLRGLG